LFADREKGGRKGREEGGRKRGREEQRKEWREEGREGSQASRHRTEITPRGD
jgi:hypothetical protein